MEHEALLEKIRDFPRTPGVYLMKDARGRVIYVGKAVSLRNRVGQYFQPSADLGPRKEQMVAEVADIEFLPAESELRSPLVREVRGRGLLVGVELRQRVTPLLKALLERGVLALPAGPTVLRLLPPLVI